MEAVHPLVDALRRPRPGIVLSPQVAQTLFNQELATNFIDTPDYERIAQEYGVPVSTLHSIRGQILMDIVLKSTALVKADAPQILTRYYLDMESLESISRSKNFSPVGILNQLIESPIIAGHTFYFTVDQRNKIKADPLHTLFNLDVWAQAALRADPPFLPSFLPPTAAPLAATHCIVTAPPPASSASHTVLNKPPRAPSSHAPTATATISTASSGITPASLPLPQPQPLFQPPAFQPTRPSAANEGDPLLVHGLVKLIFIRVLLRDMLPLMRPTLQRIYSDILKADEIDAHHGRAKIMCRDVGNLGEERLYTALRQAGVYFITEDEQRSKLKESNQPNKNERTPDARLPVPILVRGRPVFWIDSKADFGSTYMHNRNKDQLSSYCIRFKQGLVIYWYGYDQSIEDHSPDILVLDHFPDPSEIMQLPYIPQPSLRNVPIFKPSMPSPYLPGPPAAFSPFRLQQQLPVPHHQTPTHTVAVTPPHQVQQQQQHQPQLPGTTPRTAGVKPQRLETML